MPSDVDVDDGGCGGEGAGIPGGRHHGVVVAGVEGNDWSAEMGRDEAHGPRKMILRIDKNLCSPSLFYIFLKYKNKPWSGNTLEHAFTTNVYKVLCGLATFNNK